MSNKIIWHIDIFFLIVSVWCLISFLFGVFVLFCLCLFAQCLKESGFPEEKKIVDQASFLVSSLSSHSSSTFSFSLSFFKDFFFYYPEAFFVQPPLSFRDKPCNQPSVFSFITFWSCLPYQCLHFHTLCIVITVISGIYIF